jgi:2-polyprenyl-3-methyl-5-hydroxy-6-metoxy-1,4-benzoquinol methylase
MSRTKQVWQKVAKMNMDAGFTLGPINTESVLKDPKHLLFTLSRYKFAAKMLWKARHVIEVGCGEGLGTLMFLSETSAKITAIDFDERQILCAERSIVPIAGGRISFLCRDLVSEPYAGPRGDGLVCLDVIEHVHSREEQRFLTHVAGTLKKGAVAILGTPNKDASKYASPRSRVGHINLFDANRFRKTLGKNFSQVFIFSMNDEMVHTGYARMAHYLMALCIK